jgi:hypothetical protein
MTVPFAMREAAPPMIYFLRNRQRMMVVQEAPLNPDKILRSIENS